MSFRDCRNFTEMLRSLNYPRLVSLENFKKPNFELVADILYWLAQRYDPNSNISDNINEERDRVDFIKAITTLFSSKARIVLNPKKLYQADSGAVQEMLKITTVLYRAYNSSAVEEEEAGTFSLPTKISNLKSHKILANEINELGAKLYDSLSKETDLKKSRQDALNFLDSMGRSDSAHDQAYIEKCVKEIIKQQDDSMAELTKYVSNMQREQKNLDDKIKKKAAELERAEKRYKSLVNVKPAFMDEYERLEAELERLYQVYVEKYRNIDYLEQQLDEYNKEEDERFRRAQKARQKIAEKNNEEMLKREDQEIDAALEIAGDDDMRGVSRGDSRSKQNRNEQAARSTNQGGNAYRQAANQRMQPQHEEEQSEEEDVQGESGEDLDDDEDDDPDDF